MRWLRREVRIRKQKDITETKKKQKKVEKLSNRTEVLNGLALIQGIPELRKWMKL